MQDSLNEKKFTCEPNTAEVGVEESLLARWYAAYDMVVADPERAKWDKGVRPGGACVPGQAEREPRNQFTRPINLHFAFQVHFSSSQQP